MTGTVLTTDAAADALAAYADPANPERAKKLAELRAKRSELQAAREARAAQRDADDELEAEERAIRDEQALADAEEKYGRVGRDLAAVDTDFGVVILKRAHQATFRRFMESGEDTKTEDLMRLVRPSIVYPSPGDFDGYIDQQPMILARCAKAVSQLAGLRTKETSAK
jgi:hypothetical protein